LKAVELAVLSVGRLVVRSAEYLVERLVVLLVGRMVVSWVVRSVVVLVALLGISVRLQNVSASWLAVQTAGSKAALLADQWDEQPSPSCPE